MFATSVLLETNSTNHKVLLTPFPINLAQLYLLTVIFIRAQTFYIEGEISLPHEFQFLDVLCCSECEHLVRMKRKKIIQCTLLIPRCEFEVEITDASGTVTTTMSDKLAEKMLPITPDQIYETTIVHKQLIPVEHVREELSQKWFKIHLQKSLLRMPDKTPGSLVILSLTQKETIFNLLAVSLPTNVTARGKRKMESRLL